MKEGIDPILKAEWEEKIGIPEEPGIEMVPIRPETEGLIKDKHKAEETPPAKFSYLSEDIQDQILAVAKKYREEGRGLVE